MAAVESVAALSRFLHLPTVPLPAGVGLHTVNGRLTDKSVAIGPPPLKAAESATKNSVPVPLRAATPREKIA